MHVPNIARAFASFNRTYRPKNAFRRHPKGRPPQPERPRNFIRYRDPQGRFALSYPRNWTLRRGGGVQISSAALGSFVRVDLVPDEPQFWKQLARDMEAGGARTRIRSHGGHHPVHVKGTVQVRGTWFDWDAFAWPLGKLRVILSLGNVVDPRRSATIERYEDGILASIRRAFVVRGG